MVDPISVSDAARALDVSPARVRAMVAGGQLPASKIGSRWLIERSAVERRRRQGGLPGRRFTPLNAWAVLLLASGEEAEGVASGVRSRLRRALALEGLGALAPRLDRRAQVSAHHAHSGEIRHLLEDELLMRSGKSAAAFYDLGLVPGENVDGYLPESQLERLRREHALLPSAPIGNVTLRAVPDEAWGELGSRPVAPVAAVALDLMAEPDARSRQAGRELLHDLERFPR